jgi:opacity protein-like surface antigen
MEAIAMKRLSFLSTAILIGFLAAPLQAGTETFKQAAPPPPPPELYGLGFYGAIDMGANVFQNRGGDRTFTADDRRLDPTDRDFDATLEVSPKNDVGFYGGIKLGYVFGTGVVRPTIEGDFFYNGFRGGADFTLRDRFGDVVAQRNVTTWINTGAFMGNFILRFAFGRFQPYAGGGVGIYYAESAGVEVRDPVTNRVPINTGGGASHADFAWQVVAGSDYYWNPKFSTFIEYHYLNYTSSQIETRESRNLGQHLVGAGVRLHF